MNKILTLSIITLVAAGCLPITRSKALSLAKANCEAVGYRPHHDSYKWCINQDADRSMMNDRLARQSRPNYIGVFLQGFSNGYYNAREKRAWEDIRATREAVERIERDSTRPGSDLLIQ